LGARFYPAFNVYPYLSRCVDIVAVAEFETSVVFGCHDESPFFETEVNYLPLCWAGERALSPAQLHLLSVVGGVFHAVVWIVFDPGIDHKPFHSVIHGSVLLSFSLSGAAPSTIQLAASIQTV
jgi:hypothetical protein